MLRIRLSRTGKKRQASYRVVVADIDSKRDGRIVERIGHYNPRTEPEHDIKEDRALYWLSVGAQPSDAVRRLLEKQGTYTRLGRLHSGEKFDALVAEYRGVELPEATMAHPQAAAATAAVAEMTQEMGADETQEESESILDKVKEVVSNAAEAVGDAAGSVVETVKEVVTPSSDDDSDAKTEEE